MLLNILEIINQYQSQILHKNIQEVHLMHLKEIGQLLHLIIIINDKLLPN